MFSIRELNLGLENVLSLSLVVFGGYIWPFGRKKDSSFKEELTDSQNEEETPSNWAVAINLALLGRYEEALSIYGSRRFTKPCPSLQHRFMPS